MCTTAAGPDKDDNSDDDDDDVHGAVANTTTDLDNSMNFTHSESFSEPPQASTISELASATVSGSYTCFLQKTQHMNLWLLFTISYWCTISCR